MRCDYLPRYKDVEYPDVGDIHRFGLKSSTGSDGKNIRGFHKNKKSKAITRRYWKRREKFYIKLEMLNTLNNY